METYQIAQKLAAQHDASHEELLFLIEHRDERTTKFLTEKARELSVSHFGKKIFVRGLIEISNYCRNDCLYCGIRRSNANVQRYRLTKEEILECCKEGYGLGFRTFVMQGGEDMFYSDDMMTAIIAAIRASYPDCAITLSLGEKSRESYQRFYDAGANRYLLRHETADPAHYSKLHPAELSLENRLRCLRDLKEIGYQTGCGAMIGSPFQTTENIVQDLEYMKKFQPQMIGMGPFIPHHETPFAKMAAGSAELTLFLLAVVRLMHPKVLLPATTALGTIEGDGRERGVLAGCNVIMPNLSPLSVRKKYMLYDNKISTGDEAAQAREALKSKMAAIGYEVVTERGDYSEQPL